MRKRINRNTIRELITDGWTHKQIAEHLGCSEYTIFRARRELGLEPANNPMTPERRATIQTMLDDGWSWLEIERTEGANWDTMQRHFPGTQWTQKQVHAHRLEVRDANEGIRAANYARKDAA
ncbi:helix-turn-helix domain-containing protein [Arthrobacter luteolus]|uniref:helix-turn-helix domain-containing protein n=1 Tax=Arthrobacter luteolus TaxID=98672 RepID=UPI00082AE34D|nr:helix-turn-helix domain-containing protein [Arthrobacter luteolus]